MHGMGILGFPRRISDYADQLTGVMQHHGSRSQYRLSHSNSVLIVAATWSYLALLVVPVPALLVPFSVVLAFFRVFGFCTSSADCGTN